MKTLFHQVSHRGRRARALALCLLALAAVALHAPEARAQWTAPDAQGHINSTNTGSVGIGTTTPSGQFHVSTATTSTNRGIVNEQRSADPQSALFTFTKSRAGAAVQNGDNIGNIFTAASDGTNFVSPARLRFAVDGPVAANSVPTSLQFWTGVNGNGGVERMRITSGGNVGIGTAGPPHTLSVFTPSGTRSGLSITGDGNPWVYADLHMAPATTSAITAGKPVNFAWSVRKDAYYGGDASGPSMVMEVWRQGGGAYVPFIVNPSGNVILAGATNAANGNVGIGTLAPVSKLHVAGDITVDGNINAKYQDLAEWVPSKQKLSAGTVVVLDKGHDNHVLASSTAYDTRVAGVVSAQPGIALGERGEGKALVATTGRVKVKVDATRGAIQIGDLIVTSDVAGVAMRSEPVSLGGVSIHRPGTIIGKALESLDKGTGEILVLLSLQ